MRIFCEDKKTRGLEKSAVFLGVILLLATSCATLNTDEPTLPPSTQTPAATKTSVPTATVTPDFEIDLVKFNNFPESYDFLLAHLDEFVQSPDPISERSAFDRWFSEQLVPALGLKSGRPINVINKGGGGGLYAWNQYFDFGSQTLNLPPFFWFETSFGEVIAVPCITTTTKGYEEVSMVTVCPALFDSPALIYGKRAIKALSSGQDIHYIDIYYDPENFRSDLNWGHAAAMVKLIGDYPIDENGVKFGFGCIEFFDK